MRAAVAALTITALSQASFVIGLGSSCSQPLFANRPSRTHGSLRNAISNPDAAVAGVGAAGGLRTEMLRAGNAVFGMTPSCSHRRQPDSNSGESPAGPDEV